MFSKFFSVTLFAAIALAQIDPGVYKITSSATGGGVWARETLEYYLLVSLHSFSYYSHWKVEPGQEPGSFTFQDVAFGYYAAALSDAHVVTSLNKTSFDVQHDGDGKYIIKELNKNSVWTLGPSLTDVALGPANGDQTQIWAFTPLKD